MQLLAKGTLDKKMYESCDPVVFYDQDHLLLEDVSNNSPTSADKTFELIPNPCAEK